MRLKNCNFPFYFCVCLLVILPVRSLFVLDHDDLVIDGLRKDVVELKKALRKCEVDHKNPLYVPSWVREEVK